MRLVRPDARGRRRFLPRAAALAAILAVLPAAWPAARVAAQDRPTGVVAGRVTVRADTGRPPLPLAGATVIVASGAAGAGAVRTAAAGADGRFLLDRVPAGPATLTVRLIGHRTAQRAIVVVAGDTVRVDVELARQAQLLAPVRTGARPADAEAFEARPNVGVVTLEAAAMAGVPRVGEADVARVVQLLPGVVARNDFNAGLNVRGGEADQNLVLLDGHPIYNPFHLGGIFSTFMDATVGGIELLTGAFPARHGGRLSSVLDVRSADPARAGIHGSADLSVLAASARLTGAGERGAWSLAARRTYVDALAAAFTDDPYPYHFRDVHGRATYALPGDVRLAVTGYAGHDYLDVDIAALEDDSLPQSAGAGLYAFDWGNRVLGVTLARDWGPGARLPLLGGGEGVEVEQRVSVSEFTMRLDLGDGAFTQRNATRDLRASGAVTARGLAHDRSLGYEVAAHRLRFTAGAAQTGTTEFDLVQRPVSAALWIDDLWRVGARWIVQGGLRAESFSGRRWAALSPRASVKWFATPALALTAAGGRVTQAVHSMAGDGPMRFFDVWLASDPYIPVATAWHWVAGAERRLGDAGSVRVEGFLKRYDRVLEANPSDDPSRRGDELVPAEGRSYGVDLFARWQPRDRLGGWIAYTYGVGARWRGDVRWAPSQDRRHNVNAVATWQLAKYRLGARFGWATGTPFTPIVGELARRVWDPSRDRWGTGDPRIFVEPIGGARNGARFPASHRLDLDVSREFALGRATVAPYVSVVNAYNAPNVFVYLYDYSTAYPDRRAISQFPVLPSAGVRVAF